MYYMLDSNIYINFYDRYYRMEFFPTFWKKLKYVLNSKVVIPDIVVSENYQDVLFKEWLADHYDLELLKHKTFEKEWADVIKYVDKSPYYKDSALTSTKGWANPRIADPWLIAIAQKENYVIVTDEVKNPNLNSINPSKNAKIPDVCDQLGISCISMNQFFKEVNLSI